MDGDFEAAQSVLHGDGLAEFILRELWDVWDEDEDQEGTNPTGAMWQAVGDLERVTSAVSDFFEGRQ